jgi:hypothetical protein
MSESVRLQEDQQRGLNWKRWGPYLPERQWSTVREDYSENGDVWNSFDHDMARSRAYRWGEDGILGWCDRQCRLCFAPVFWNGQDPILKERLFGLTGPQGNHGEDVKEVYFYLESTPTHSYDKGLYKYPRQAFPYQSLIQENAQRGRLEPEFELQDTGLLDDDYFDCLVEYAKGSPDDTLIRLSLTYRGTAASADLVVLPQLWFRNSWSWGRQGEGHTERPSIAVDTAYRLKADHPTLGSFHFWGDGPQEWIFCENETNRERLYGVPNQSSYVKDGFHDFVVQGRTDRVGRQSGTKAASVRRLHFGPGQTHTLQFRLCSATKAVPTPFGADFDAAFEKAKAECQAFFDQKAPQMCPESRAVWQQSLAGLFWSKKFYYYSVQEWLDGDPSQPKPPASRKQGRNHRWAGHLYNRDVILLPDPWEYPWYASWDTAFHVVPLANLDPDFAKQQLLLMTREWYMHPNGQIPAYEWNFEDVNPPVQAWSTWQVYKRSPDPKFLRRMFHKLLLNFTWWVNRTDEDGNNVFSGGFLGLDNIGPFDRSQFKGGSGEQLEQSDATSWLAFFCLQMLQISLELAKQDESYEDIASKFFEHFASITYGMNNLGLWDEKDGFYYDVIRQQHEVLPLKVRSMVGLLPLIAVDYIAAGTLDRFPGFQRRMRWFLKNRPELSQHLEQENGDIVLALATRPRLERILEKLLDPAEFLSPYGIRSLSKFHLAQPYRLDFRGQRYVVGYEPGESQTQLFGGNSNWRGPIWFPVNILLIQSLEQYYKFYGDTLLVSNPDKPEDKIDLHQLAQVLRGRLLKLFVPDENGSRPSHRHIPQHIRPDWQGQLFFHEYFHADTGQGLGSLHQTGWTALIATLIEQLSEQGNQEAHCA